MPSPSVVAPPLPGVDDDVAVAVEDREGQIFHVERDAIAEGQQEN